MQNAARVQELSPSAKVVLRVVASANGRGLTVHRVAGGAGCCADKARQALQELRTFHLVEDKGGWFKASPQAKALALLDT